uniref:Uncharacterized protein n=1 Tax=viral metagenome TaxID=1070528 RepID=A0A2V0RHY3_9ZZZZ
MPQPPKRKYGKVSRNSYRYGYNQGYDEGFQAGVKSEIEKQQTKKQKLGLKIEREDDFLFVMRVLAHNDENPKLFDFHDDTPEDVQVRVVQNHLRSAAK